MPDHLQFHHLEILADRIEDHSFFRQTLEKTKASGRITDKQFDFLMRKVELKSAIEHIDQGEDSPF